MKDDSIKYQKRIKVLTPTNMKRKLTFILFDVISFSASILLAFFFMTDLIRPQIISRYSYLTIFLFIAIKVPVFAAFGLYDISWRSVSLQDLAKIAKACLLSSGIVLIILYGFNFPGITDFPKSVLLIDLIFSFLFSAGFKISKRMYIEVMRHSIYSPDLKRTIIIGAGSSGEQIIRDINRSTTRIFKPIGFIDDDPSKQNFFLQGVKVLGTTNELFDIIKRYDVHTIIISILAADRNFHRKVLNISREAGVREVKVVSSVNDISDSIHVSINDLRDIDVCDLIGRQAVSINTKMISAYLKDKRILITGAAGSIGSEIARQICFYEPKQLAIVDINESDLSDLEIQLNRLYAPGRVASYDYEERNPSNIENNLPGNNNKIKMYLCDISNMKKVENMFEDFHPDVVFHAAAYKHLPVMEKFPEEAVRVNIIGTYILATAANRFGVENFVLISTDKAVNPTSIMGASKRIAENIVTGIGNGSASNFVAVRFGNVIGSRGSALPVFMNQLKTGGPITITHPDMKRYFMTIPEAVALVLQAGATGRNGDVFVLDMGEAIKIVDLANELILLNNLVPGKDIKIEYTGIREGEKLFEEILSAEEGVTPTSHEKIFKARLISMYNEKSINTMIDDFNSILGYSTKEDWIALFKYYIPNFQHSMVIDQLDSEVCNNELMPNRSNSMV